MLESRRLTKSIKNYAENLAGFNDPLDTLRITWETWKEMTTKISALE